MVRIHWATRPLGVAWFWRCDTLNLQLRQLGDFQGKVKEWEEKREEPLAPPFADERSPLNGSRNRI